MLNKKFFVLLALVPKLGWAGLADSDLVMLLERENPTLKFSAQGGGRIDVQGNAEAFSGHLIIPKLGADDYERLEPVFDTLSGFGEAKPRVFDFVGVCKLKKLTIKGAPPEDFEGLILKPGQLTELILEDFEKLPVSRSFLQDCAALETLTLRNGGSCDALSLSYRLCNLIVERVQGPAPATLSLPASLEKMTLRG